MDDIFHYKQMVFYCMITSGIFRECTLPKTHMDMGRMAPSETVYLCKPLVFSIFAGMGRWCMTTPLVARVRFGGSRTDAW